MPFLSPTELMSVIPDDVQEQMTNEQQVVQIIEEQIAMITTYLRPGYDTETIFAATGSKRNLALLSVLKDLVLTRIYTINGREINEVAEQRQAQAMDWLDKVSKGQLTPDLARMDQDGDGMADNIFVGGSNPRYDTSIL